MTFGIIEMEEPLVAELISLAFESAGHDCLVLKNVEQATRVLDALYLDSIVLDLHASGGSGLDWLETAVTSWPDLPARTLLLTRAEVTSEEAARIAALGVEIAPRPDSVTDVGRVVMERLRKVETEQIDRPRLRRSVPGPQGEYVN